jgi:hypothetical protein
MKTEAIAAGFYETEYGKFPKIQILTITELFTGKRLTRCWAASIEGNGPTGCLWLGDLLGTPARPI